MKYIKNYYDENDYKDIIKYFFKLCFNENFLSIDNDIYSDIKKSIDDISKNCVNGKIKSDKKLFFTVREYFNNIIIKHDILEKNNCTYYKIGVFKSNDYFNYNNNLNHYFFLLDYDI